MANYYDYSKYLVSAVTPVPEGKKFSLEGKWKVLYWPFSYQEKEIIKKEFNDKDWDEISVPGPAFLRSPWESPSEDKDEIKLTHINPEDGCFLRYSFYLPQEFKDNILKLRFDGVYPCCRVWLNETLLGEKYSGLVPFEFDVTKLCRFDGPNVLCVRIYRKHPFVRLDMPRWVMGFAGIHRDVFISILPSVHITECKLDSTLDDRFTDGILRVTTNLRNSGCLASKLEVSVGVFDQQEGNQCINKVIEKVHIEPETVYPLSFTINIDKCKKWTAETPNLYHVVLKLLHENGQETEYCYKIGFRKFELKNERPLLNGVPLKFRGINRLEFHPVKGLVQDEEWLRKEVFLIKRANINGVRTHIFPCEKFVEICDEMGLYIIQEIPMDWCPDLIAHEENLFVFFERIRDVVCRDRNHPSILAWGVGNENMAYKEDERDKFMNHSRIMKKLLKQLDPERPVLFPPPGPLTNFKAHMEAELGDIGDIHYTLLPLKELKQTGEMTLYTSWEKKPGSMERYNKKVSLEELKNSGWSGVWFSSEYFAFGSIPELLEAPYLSQIADEPSLSSTLDTFTVFKERLRKEWGYMENDPTCLGGAFFNLKDPATGKEWGWVNYDEGVPWGILDPYLNPKPFYWILRSIFAPVKVQKVVQYLGEGTVYVEIQNLLNFTSLKECKCIFQESNAGRYLGMTDIWRELIFDIPPNSSRKVEIKLNSRTRKFLEEGQSVILRFTFLDPCGYIITVCDTVVNPQDKRKKGSTIIEPCEMGEV